MNLICQSTIRLIGLLCFTCLSTTGAPPSYFVVAEFPGHELHHDSYILALTNTDDIAHARALISSEPELESRLVVAKIAAGPDGINRDYRKKTAPPWSWHVTEFLSFAEHTIEILDGWPTFVESDVDGWIAGTSGAIGFWSYTVVDELPLAPEISAVSFSANHIQLTIQRLSLPFVADIECSRSMIPGSWSSVHSFAITNVASVINLPVDITLPSAFCGVKVHSGADTLMPSANETRIAR